MSIVTGKYNARVIWHDGPMSDEEKKTAAEKQKHVPAHARKLTKPFLSVDVSEHEDLVRTGLKIVRIGDDAMKAFAKKGTPMKEGDVIVVTKISYGDGKPSMVLGIE